MSRTETRQEELTTIFRLGLEHLIAEVVGDESVVPAELGDELVRIVVEPEGHRGQLQSGGPAFGPGDQCGHPVNSERATGDALEQHRGVDLIEGQVGLADLCQLAVDTMATPGDRKIGARREHQMNIGRDQIDETTQIGEEDRVRKVVEVVEDDDDLGELGHLCLKSFE